MKKYLLFMHSKRDADIFRIRYYLSDSTALKEAIRTAKKEQAELIEVYPLERGLVAEDAQAAVDAAKRFIEKEYYEDTKYDL